MVAKASILRPRGGLWAVGACLLLTACSGPQADDGAASGPLSSLNPLPSLEKMMSGGWLFGDTVDVPPPRSPEPIYCYETLGVRDCHEAPLEDGGNRLVGFEGPPPPPYLRPPTP